MTDGPSCPTCTTWLTSRLANVRLLFSFAASQTSRSPLAFSGRRSTRHHCCNPVVAVLAPRAPCRPLLLVGLGRMAPVMARRSDGSVLGRPVVAHRYLRLAGLPTPTAPWRALVRLRRSRRCCRFSQLLAVQPQVRMVTTSWLTMPSVACVPCRCLFHRFALLLLSLWAGSW